jgi:hypothetical protein
MFKVKDDELGVDWISQLLTNFDCEWLMEHRITIFINRVIIEHQ